MARNFGKVVAPARPVAKPVTGRVASAPAAKPRQFAMFAPPPFSCNDCGGNEMLLDTHGEPTHEWYCCYWWIGNGKNETPF